MDGIKPINNIIEYLIAQYFNMFMWKIWNSYSNYSKLPPFTLFMHFLIAKFWYNHDDGFVSHFVMVIIIDTSEA